MTVSDMLQQGREAFRRRAWGDAYSSFCSAESDHILEPEDLERMAKAAYLIGNESGCTERWTRAHHAFRKRGDALKAADCAFWLGMVLFNRGEHAQGGGWIARAGRLVEETGKTCVEQGFLLVPEALQHLRAGDASGAHDLFGRAIETGRRFDNSDLVTLGRLGSGQALIHRQKIAEGTALLDEAMIAVVADEISPIVAGIVYCAVLDTCQKIYDLSRAQEWTEALSRWCDSQPDLIPYRGQCMVRRAEIMQLHGEWPDAMDEAQRACDLSPVSTPPATGGGHYRRGELYRLQGEFSEAEEAYRLASKWGRKPQPGLALLRLAQGQTEAAEVAIRRVEEEVKDRAGRSAILPACVEIMLACGDLETAEAAAGELSEIAAALDAPFLWGVAHRALGSVLLAKGEPREALEHLRKAWNLFNKIEVTYEEARTRVLIGQCCREIGDEESAEMEMDAARWIFDRLGAAPDLSHVNRLLGETQSGSGHGLTPREQEVLRLLATGKTNKAIASELFISERTVDRHVSNILGKLDLPSRSAATAYAWEHGLT